MSTPIGLVLAGGAGRRLGSAKGYVRLAGSPLALRAAKALAQVCSGVIVSVRPGFPNPAPGFAAIEDPPPAGRGPLAGIGAVMAATARSDLLVLACDYPRVGVEILRRLVECSTDTVQDDVIHPRDSGGRDHPLVGVWRRHLAPRIGNALERGDYCVGDLLATCRARRLGPESFAGLDLDAMLVNVNRPEDLDRLGDR